MRSEITKLVREHVALDEGTKRLITMATCDLYDGPLAVDDPDYPGFETACARIRDALDSHRSLWVNVECGHVQETEPQWTVTCGECDGTGWVECDSCDGVVEPPCELLVKCDYCNGVGELSCELPEDWMQLDSRHIRAALVGKELAFYV